MLIAHWEQDLLIRTQVWEGEQLQSAGEVSGQAIQVGEAIVLAEAL